MKRRAHVGSAIHVDMSKSSVGDVVADDRGGAVQAQVVEPRVTPLLRERVGGERNRRRAATHSGVGSGRRTAVTLRGGRGGPLCRLARGVFLSRHPEGHLESRVHRPRLFALGCLAAHSFHRRKSASATKPCLCPYQSMSMESRWKSLSVHGSPAARPARGIGNPPASLWSRMARDSVGT